MWDPTIRDNPLSQMNSQILEMDTWHQIQDIGMITYT